MLKKTSFYIVTLISGIGMIIMSFVLRGIVEKSISGVLIGIGAGLFGMSVSNLVMKYHEKKHPELAKQTAIELKDERNEVIRNKARAKSGSIIQWFVMGLAYVMIIANSSLWLIGLTVGIFALYNVLSVYFMGKYQKEM